MRIDKKTVFCDTIAINHCQSDIYCYIISPHESTYNSYNVKVNISVY